MPLHIPDDELHAHLDQALPRSRCVTLETHLANCDWCRGRRDEIAALRDQTTLLLARLTPERRRIPPSYEELERRVAARPPVPAATGIGRLAWAASLLLAVTLGYSARAMLRDGTEDRRVPSSAALASPPQSPPREAAPASPPVLQAAVVARAARAARTPAPTEGAELALRRSDVGTPSPTAVEVSSGSLPVDAAPLDGLWRSVPWEQASEPSGGAPPRVSGVPVVEVQVQPSQAQGQPLTVVAQQLTSGELITTIEGPVEDVWALLSRRGDAGDTAGAEAVRRGDRMLAVTGQLPPDSLRAMVRRVNAAQRVR